jgi:hypothetical protein
MTPELKTSCEVVFQEHKASACPVAWNKDVFRGRMSIGLCEMAKQTLVQKNIIYFPKPAKKTVTILNPVVAEATTFEEAVAMIQNKVSPSLEDRAAEQHVYTGALVSEHISHAGMDISQLIRTTGKQETAMTHEQWHLRPLFFYVVWPVSAAIISVLIAYLLSAYVEMTYRR